MARLAKAILSEFGREDGNRIMGWLIEVIAAWGKVSARELKKIRKEAR